MHSAIQQQAWRFLDTSRADGYENMAIDEAIYISCQQGTSPPTLRLYGWQPPAVSLGYFQKAEAAVDLQACRRLGIDVVRRMTGGRAVVHNRELTYSVIAPEHASPFSPRVLETYMAIGRCLMKALRGLGLDAHWVAARDKHRVTTSLKQETASCFSAPSWYEITVEGKKICGSAQKRGNGVFLQHGSILIEHQPALMAAVLRSGKSTEDFLKEIEDSTTSINHHLGNRLDVAELKDTVRSGFTETLGVSLQPGMLSGDEVQCKEMLRRKYQSDDWNLLRVAPSPAFTPAEGQSAAPPREQQPLFPGTIACPG